MTNNYIKNIINEELDKELQRYGTGKLYIFDFDETLASDDALAYIVKSNGTRIPINHSDYKHYEPLPGEYIDVTEFQQLNNPVPNMELINLLKSLQDTSIILTARTMSEPISNYLKSFGINVPVFAIGLSDPKHISVKRNAKRKAEFTTNLINKFGLNHIEFWDDNKVNIYEMEKLKDIHSNVNILTNLVVFTK